MKTEHRRRLLRLVEKERIQFHSPQDRQPGNHGQVFEAVHQLGGYKFDEYTHNFTYEDHQKPWRATIKRRVERIVRLAEDCRLGQQNEFCWRL